MKRNKAFWAQVYSRSSESGYVRVFEDGVFRCDLSVSGSTSLDVDEALANSGYFPVLWKRTQWGWETELTKKDPLDELFIKKRED